MWSWMRDRGCGLTGQWSPMPHHGAAHIQEANLNMLPKRHPPNRSISGDLAVSNHIPDYPPHLISAKLRVHQSQTDKHIAAPQIWTRDGPLMSRMRNTNPFLSIANNPTVSGINFPFADEDTSRNLYCFRNTFIVYIKLSDHTLVVV